MVIDDDDDEKSLLLRSEFLCRDLDPCFFHASVIFQICCVASDFLVKICREIVFSSIEYLFFGPK